MTTKPSAVAYRRDDLKHVVSMSLITRKRVIGKQAMISQVFLQKDCFVPTHEHENEQFAHIVSGRLCFGTDVSPFSRSDCNVFDFGDDSDVDIDDYSMLFSA